MEQKPQADPRTLEHVNIWHADWCGEERTGACSCGAAEARALIQQQAERLRELEQEKDALQATVNTAAFADLQAILTAKATAESQLTALRAGVEKHVDLLRHLWRQRADVAYWDVGEWADALSQLLTEPAQEKSDV